MKNTLFRYLWITLLLTGLAGCASSPDADDPTTQYTVEELYEEAKEALNKSNYETAIQLYEKLESRFPYGPYAERAQLEIIYAYYKDMEPDTAILAADRFIKLHPNHALVDYAYYLRGLAAFDLSKSFFEKVFDQEKSERDPKMARQAFDYFAQLVERFPTSKYTEDSANRMKQLRDNLAHYEIHVAQYYLRRGAYLAAANRGKYVVENYQGTPAVADALALMIRAYRKLDMADLAADTFRVLELNHPNHPETLKLKQGS
ncbi:MAG: outer membrane protein assembly factor BamD [Gammaproteobacteria bacterium]